MAENGGGLSAGWVAVIGALAGAVAGVGAAVATGWFTYASKEEELQVHLVEIAIGILRADASKEDVAPAREWALDVIDQKSGVKFSKEDRKLLLHQSIQSADFSSLIEKWYKKSGVTVIAPGAAMKMIPDEPPTK
jgi:hypothetical protein